MKDMVQVKMSEHMAGHSLVGWVERPNLLTAMKSSAGMRSWLPELLHNADGDQAMDDAPDEDNIGDDEGSDSDSEDERTMPAGQEVAWDSGMKYGAVIAVLWV
jgi:hypothetical protein